MRTSGLFAAGAAMLIATASPAFAHADLMRSTPAANATVEAPKAVQLVFSERIVPAFSKIEISMVGHDMTIPVETKVSSDGKTMTGTPKGRFMKGAYKITWVAAGADGHRMKGEIPFKVG
jgi:copper resistance protein C